MAPLLDSLRARSSLCNTLRRILNADGYEEVVTPTLSPFPDGAPIPQFVTSHPRTGLRACLRIAPEEYLKRLIVAGLDRVFEFSTNFRAEEVDATHLPEFASLETMARGLSLAETQILAEGLVNTGLEAVGRDSEKTLFRPPGCDTTFRFTGPWPRISLSEALRARFGFEPDDFFEPDRVIALHRELTGPGDELAPMTTSMDAIVTWLARSFDTPVFIQHYPQYLGGPARACTEDPRFKENAELFVGSMELANMACELSDPAMIRSWYTNNVRLKRRLGITPNRLDMPLLRALEAGLPASAGLGLGIDRLLMVALGARSLQDIKPFSYGELF